MAKGDDPSLPPAGGVVAAPEMQLAPRVRTIVLHGAMGKRFGRIHRHSVSRVDEAISALGAHHPDLWAFLAEADQCGVGFQIFVDGELIEQNMLQSPIPDGTLEIVPVVHGGKGGVLQIVLGVVLIVVGVIMLAYGAPDGNVVLIGAALVAGGIASTLAGVASLLFLNQPLETDSESGPSGSAFSGVENTIAAGGPVPVLMGEMMIGSATIGTSLKAERDNALSLHQVGVIVDLLSVGPIEGLIPRIREVNKDAGRTDASVAPSIFLNETPVWEVTGLPRVEGAGWRRDFLDKTSMDPGIAYTEVSQQGVEFNGSLGTQTEEEPPPQDSRRGDEHVVATLPVTMAQRAGFMVHSRSVTFAHRTGENDQTPIKGVGGVKVTRVVGQELKNGLPVTRATPAGDKLTSIRLNFSIPSLVHAGKKGPAEVGISWLLSVTDAQGRKEQRFQNFKARVLTRKSMSIEIPVPTGSTGPYTIECQKTSVDTGETSSETSSVLLWDTYVQIQDSNLMYPLSAIVATRYRSDEHGGIPRRAYHTRGIKVRVPSNYDPVTRVYSGDWDGTYKAAVAYTNNPAWLLLETLTNKEWGLGERVSDASINKWALYSAAQYCDALVDSGQPNKDFGFGLGLEPRFQLNAYLRNKVEALQFVGQLISVFRAMLFYGAGQIAVSPDRQVSPVYVFTPANIVDGQFKYATSQDQQRFTVVTVKWANPDNFYRPQIEEVEDEAGVRVRGIIRKEITAFGCTSRGQARRAGLWELGTAQRRTKLVGFKTGKDAAHILPGQVFATIDPRRKAKRWGGRIKAAIDNLQVQLDAEVTIEAGKTYSLTVTQPEKVEVIRTAGTTATLVVTAIPYLSDHKLCKVLVDNDDDGTFETEIETTGYDAGTQTLRIVAQSSPGSDVNFRVVTNQGVNKWTVITAPGTTDVLRGTGPVLADMAAPERSVWILEEVNDQPDFWRMLGLTAGEGGSFEIEAVEYDDALYSAVETGLLLPDDETPILPPIVGDQIVFPPEGVRIQPELSHTETGVGSVLLVVWDDPTRNAGFIEHWEVSYRFNGGEWVRLPDVVDTHARIEAARPGFYIAEVVAIGTNGRRSLPVRASLAFDVDTAPGLLARISGLEIEGQGSDRAFLGTEVAFSWRLNSDLVESFGDDRGGAGGADEFPWLDFYEVSIFDPDTLDIIRTAPPVRGTPRFVYTRDAMISDGIAGVDPVTGDAMTFPRREFGVRVRLKDTFGNYSPASDMIVSNPAPPAITSLTLAAQVDYVMGKIVAGEQPPDLRGFLIWTSTTPGFDPLTTAPVSSPVHSVFRAEATPGTTLYVRVAPFDDFSRDPKTLNISSEFSAGVDAFINNVLDKSVLNSKLLTGSFDNLIQDGSFVNTSGGSLSPWVETIQGASFGAWSVSTAGPRAGTKNARFTFSSASAGSTMRLHANGPLGQKQHHFEAREGEEFVCTVWLRAAVGTIPRNAVGLAIAWYDEAGVWLGVTATDFGSGGNLSTSYEQRILSTADGANGPPAGSVFGQLFLQVVSDQLSSGDIVDFDDVQCRQMVSDMAIFDLSAAKITFGQMTGERLQVGTIFTDKIVLGSNDNLIPDPGFERNLTADLWLDNGGGASAWALESGAGNQRSGNHSMKWTGSGQTTVAAIFLGGSNAAQKEGHVACAEGDQFYFEFYGKADNAAGGADLVAWMRFFDADGVSISTPAGTAIDPGTNWGVVSVTGTAPANASYVVFLVIVKTGATASYFIDDTYARRLTGTRIIEANAITNFQSASLVSPVQDFFDGTISDKGTWKTIMEFAAVPTEGGLVTYGLVGGIEVIQSDPQLSTLPINITRTPKIRLRVVRDPAGSAVVLYQSGRVNISARGYLPIAVPGFQDVASVGNHTYRAELIWDDDVYDAGQAKAGAPNGGGRFIDGTGTRWMDNTSAGHEFRFSTGPGTWSAWFGLSSGPLSDTQIVVFPDPVMPSVFTDYQVRPELGGPSVTTLVLDLLEATQQLAEFKR